MIPKHYFGDWWIFDDRDLFVPNKESFICINCNAIVSMKILGNCCTIIGLQSGVFHTVNHSIQDIISILPKNQ